MSGERRTVPARIGIVALNLLQPGLGLLRLGRLASAFALVLVFPAALLLILLFYAAGPTLTLTTFLIDMAFLALAVAAALLASMVLSWRLSAGARVTQPWWSRWYSILAVAIVVQVLAIMLVDTLHGLYKPFYLPSEAMAPTLLRNDRLVAAMRAPKHFRRGDIILFDMGEATYIKRIAGLPGDRIALSRGIVTINGEIVPQRFLRTERADLAWGGPEVRRLAEQFPGEPSPHQIYDLGPSPSDEMAEQIVWPGHLFVLGDNRDMSADSRVPRESAGVEQLPIGDVRGIALFYTWGPSHRTGEPLSREHHSRE